MDRIAKRQIEDQKQAAQLSDAITRLQQSAAEHRAARRKPGKQARRNLAIAIAVAEGVPISTIAEIVNLSDSRVRSVARDVALKQ